MKQTLPVQLPRPLDVPHTAPGYDDEAPRPGGNGLVPPPGPPSAADDHLDPDRVAEKPQAASQDGWPGRFAQVLAETLAGSRPASQLAPWTTEQARRRIRQLGPALATSQRPRVRKIMTSAPAAGVLEMTAVVGFGRRTAVLALRLEHRAQRHPGGPGGGWCCTAIDSA